MTQPYKKIVCLLMTLGFVTHAVAQEVATTTQSTTVTQQTPQASVYNLPPVAANQAPVYQRPPQTAVSPTAATNTTTTTTTTTTPDAGQNVNQFNQWLQNNGYANNQAVAPLPAAITAPPPRPRPRGQVQLSYEQGQRVMRNAIPPNSPQPSQEADMAFNQLMQRNIPLTPDQIVTLRQQIDMVQRAASIPPNIPPKPVTSTIMINLAPGTTPPAVRLAQGYVSSLVFVDSTGSPWPIAAFDVGNPKAVTIQWDGKSNIIMMQAISPYSDGDIVIRLVGLPTPITLELVSGQRVVDYRADIHVSGIGPNSKEMPVGTALPGSANQLLLGVLDGVAPAGSKQLSVRGVDSQAWSLNDRMYLRSRFTVLSPGWTGKMVSPDGMIAYELPKTSSVLISRYGEPVEVKIEGL